MKIITRRGLVTGAAALAAYASLPKDAEAMLQVNQLTGFNVQAEGKWQTTFQQTLNANVFGGFQTYTIRQVINAALFSVSGTKVRITFNASTAAAMPVDEIFIGQQASSGDAYDFAATPTEITFSGGSSGFSLSSSGSILSDEIDFVFDHTKNHIIAIDTGASTFGARGIAVGNLANADCYQKVANDAQTVDATGYAGPNTAGGADLCSISKIEVFS